MPATFLLEKGIWVERKGGECVWVRERGNTGDSDLVLPCCWEVNTETIRNKGKGINAQVTSSVLSPVCVSDTTTTCSPTTSRPACSPWWTAWLIVKTSWWTFWFQLLPSSRRSKSRRRSSTRKPWWARYSCLLDIHAQMSQLDLPEVKAKLCLRGKRIRIVLRDSAVAQRAASEIAQLQCNATFTNSIRLKDHL